MSKDEKNARVGRKFYNQIEKINARRVIDDKPGRRNRISTSKITNLIVNHDLWPKIFDTIVDTNEEEIKKYG